MIWLSHASNKIKHENQNKHSSKGVSHLRHKKKTYHVREITTIQQQKACMHFFPVTLVRRCGIQMRFVAPLRIRRSVRIAGWMLCVCLRVCVCVSVWRTLQSSAQQSWPIKMISQRRRVCERYFITVFKPLCRRRPHKTVHCIHCQHHRY